VTAPAGAAAGRWRVACDTCDAGAWIGVPPSALPWCEHCQRSVSAPRCPECGTTPATAEPRFLECHGVLQNLDAVLAAWAGDAAPLDRLLPRRPRFLTDLTPPSPAAGNSRLLAEVAAGHFGAALADATSEAASGDLASWRALAVASQRIGALAAAEAAWTRILEQRPDDQVARLNRGVLRVQDDRRLAAREDFDRAGDGFEARWNRAALRVVEAVASGRLPSDETLRSARYDAGPPSFYWSDQTIGRLLWSLLIEREAVSGAPAGATAVDRLRAAEAQFEHDTFWDRALILEGYARLGREADRTRVARPMAETLIAEIGAQPFLEATYAASMRESLHEVARHVRDGDPSAAGNAIERMPGREDLARYRIPCAACGRGTVGIEEYQSA
jgi:hypothetical protein